MPRPFPRPAPVFRDPGGAAPSLTERAANVAFMAAPRAGLRDLPRPLEPRDHGPEATGGPLLFYTWHRFGWVTYFVFQALPPPLRPVAIAHDGVRSQLMHLAGAWLGYPTFVFARNGDPPRDQIIRFARARGCHLMLLPDSGGPYGVVKPGLVEIARDIGARLVPYGIEVSPPLEVGRELHHVVPVPFARLTVHHGAPIQPTTAEDAQAALERIVAGR